MEKISLHANAETVTSGKTDPVSFVVQIMLSQCGSGSWLAWYSHREDITANGLTAVDALQNLNKMYTTVMEYEAGL